MGFKKHSVLILILLFPLLINAQNNKAKKRVLVTAFGPYQGMDINPSEKILNEMKDIENSIVKGIKKVDFSFQLLRVAYNDVDQFIRDTDFNSYDMVAMMGLMPSNKFIRVETLVMNYTDSGKDIDSVLREGTIMERAPTLLKLQENYIKKIETYIKKKKQPFIFSTDDGNYVCNYLHYLVRYNVWKVNREKPVLFFHVANTVDYSYVPSNTEQASCILGLLKYLIK